MIDSLKNILMFYEYTNVVRDMCLTCMYIVCIKMEEMINGKVRKLVCYNTQYTIHVYM